MYNPRTTREVYESLAALANRRDGPTPITNDEYYPAHAELMRWKDEFELAERIAAAHPLNPAGSYGRLLDRVCNHLDQLDYIRQHDGRYWVHATCADCQRVVSVEPMYKMLEDYAEVA